MTLNYLISHRNKNSTILFVSIFRQFLDYRWTPAGRYFIYHPQQRYTLVDPSPRRHVVNAHGRPDELTGTDSRVGAEVGSGRPARPELTNFPIHRCFATTSKYIVCSSLIVLGELSRIGLTEWTKTWTRIISIGVTVSASVRRFWLTWNDLVIL